MIAFERDPWISLWWRRWEFTTHTGIDNHFFFYFISLFFFLFASWRRKHSLLPCHHCLRLVRSFPCMQRVLPCTLSLVCLSAIDIDGASFTTAAHHNTTHVECMWTNSNDAGLFYSFCSSRANDNLSLLRVCITCEHANACTIFEKYCSDCWFRPSATTTITM